MPAAAAPAIQFKKVNKWFGPLHVLKDVALDVAPAEVVVVCGPSGSGKSTLIRCVNRLEPIQQGEIVVYGESISGNGVTSRSSAPRWGWCSSLSISSPT